jgi:hypothetical protein
MDRAVAWVTGRPAPFLVLGCLAFFYTIFGLWVLAPDAVYSGDIGVKYVQARALAEHRLTSLDIPYPGAFLDPGEEFLPMRPPFIMATAGTTQAIFSPFSAMFQAVAVAVAGMRGLVLLSIAGAVVTLGAAARLAPPDLRVPVLLALGLGSPLWFFAVSGWEHAPAVALGSAAFALAVRAGRADPTVRIRSLGSDPGRRSTYSAGTAVAVGILVGTGAVLRDEVILLVPGVLAVLWWRSRSLRTVAAAAGAAMVPLIIAAGVEVAWFHRPAAAHLRHAVHLVQRAAHLTEAPNPDVPVLTPFTLRDRYATIVQYWLLGYGNNWLIGSLCAALIVAAVLQRTVWSSIPLLVWLTAIVALAAVDLREVVTAPKWLAGLHRCSPYLVFAVMPLPFGSTGNGWLRPAILLTAAAYLLIAFAGIDTTGGKALGPRLLLPLLPLLAVSAVMGIGAYLHGPAGVDRAIGAIGVGLVSMAVAIHVLGCIPAYYSRNGDDFKGLQSVAGSGERVIVADDEFTAQLLLPLYYRRILLLADTPEASRRLGAALASQRLGSLLVVTRWSDTPIDLAPFRKRRTERRGRMTLQFWER